MATITSNGSNGAKISSDNGAQGNQELEDGRLCAPLSALPTEVFKAFGQGKITIEQLNEWSTARDALLAKSAAKSSGGNGGRVTWKVSEKGAISAYGMGRFPVTLYASQLARFANELAGGLAFAVANGDKLGLKDGEDRATVVKALKDAADRLAK